MRHDQSYKAMFSHALPVRDLLRDFVSELLDGGREWVERLDFATLEPLPTEHIDPTLRGRSNDAVWRLRFRDAGGERDWLHVLVMIEFQSRIDWFMALRVQGYAVRLYESLWSDRRPGRGDRLPPVLAVVIYNGRSRWRAVTRMAGLVGEGTRPAAARAAAAPAFTGDSYVLIDPGAYVGRTLPPDNCVSLMVATELMSDLGEAVGILETALRLLPAPDEEKLRDTFLSWFRLATGRIGVDLEFLEDKAIMEQLERTGALRTTLEERFQALHDTLRAEARAEGVEQGIEQGIERERQLLRRLTERKFGAVTAGRLAGLLAGIGDPRRLQDVGEWIIDCAEGKELIARLEDSA